MHNPAMSTNRFAGLIIQGRSDFNALSAFNLELAHALRLLGIEPIIVDLMAPDRSNGLMNKVMQDYGPAQVVAAFSFSGIGAEAGDDDPTGNIWERLKIPFITWMLDHPVHYLERHIHPGPALVRLYANKAFFDFQHDYLKAAGRAALVPLGTMSHGREPQQRTFKSGEPPLILFAKSSNSPALHEDDWKKLAVSTQQFIANVIDHYWGTTPRSGSVVDSVMTVAKATNIDLHEDMKLFSYVVSQVDWYLRYRKSDIIFRELLKLPVRIYGKGFDHIDTTGAKATTLPPIDHNDLTALYHKALAIVSINPNVDDEVHDRVKSAFGCGAMPISDINPWWEKECPQLLPYSYDFRDKPIAGAIDKTLSNPQATADLAWQVGKDMREKRTFTQAVFDAVQIALEHRNNAFGMRQTNRA
jgi:hypothetical protein